MFWIKFQEIKTKEKTWTENYFEMKISIKSDILTCWILGS